MSAGPQRHESNKHIGSERRDRPHILRNEDLVIDKFELTDLAASNLLLETQHASPSDITDDNVAEGQLWRAVGEALQSFIEFRSACHDGYIFLSTGTEIFFPK